MISQDIQQLIYEIKTAPIPGLNAIKGFGKTKRFIRNRVRDYRYMKANPGVNILNANSARLNERAIQAQANIDEKAVKLNRQIIAKQNLAKRDPNEIAAKLKERYHKGEITGEQRIHDSNVASQNIASARRDVEVDKSKTENPVETQTKRRTEQFQTRRNLYDPDLIRRRLNSNITTNTSHI
jgi:hypothetical protein